MTDNSFEPDDFDILLRRSMRARPQPQPASNLAAIAIHMAQQPAVDPAVLMLAKVNRWSRIFTALAIIVIVAIATWAIRARWQAGGFQSWTTSDTTTQTTTTTTTSTTAFTTTLTQWMPGGVILAMIAMMLILCHRAISSSDDWTTWRFEPVRG